MVGPPLLEDVYTLEDALVVGCCLITLLRHAERVCIACLAQLVNTIAPIMTENMGPAWRQTIYYPFLHVSSFGRGEVLETWIRSPVYENKTFGEVPYLESIATWNGDAGELALFAVNRSTDQELLVEGKLAGFGSCDLVEHLVLVHEDPKAANTRESPGSVTPRRIDTTQVDKGSLRAVLPRLSWNVIRLRSKGSP
jgi:alpha-N-arabinofuranosidase